MLRVCFAALLLSGAAAGKTWYVRMDGGTSSQCTGAADAPYRGSGAAQPCAFSNPFYLFTNDPPRNVAATLPVWKIAGGDTVVIRNGDYKVGFRTPDANGWWNFLGCRGNNRFCYNPPIPAGTAENPTRIVGEEWESGCRTKPILRSGGAVNTTLNLFDTSNVEVSCLEFTDNAECRILTLAGDPRACVTYTSDFGYWAIQTNENSKSITLRNLFIHGMAGAGIAGAVGGNVLVENVHLRANGNFGWNFDPGGQRPSAGPLTIRKSIIEWSACVERLPVADPVILACYDQDGANANGDALGFVDVTGDVTIDQTIVRYNQQDGLDALYIKSASNLTVANSQFYGNSGQQIKTGGAANTVIRNNLIVGNCDRQREGVPGVTAPNFNTYLKSYCRASDMSALVFKNDTALTFENNSIATYAPTTFDIQCTAVTDIFNASGRRSTDGSLEATLRPDGSRRSFPTAFRLRQISMTGAVYVHPAVGSRVAKRVGRRGIDAACAGAPCQYWYVPETAELVQDAAEPPLSATDELRVTYADPAFCDAASMRFRNNVVRGYTRLISGTQPGGFWFNNFLASPVPELKSRENNVYCGLSSLTPASTERWMRACPGNLFDGEPGALTAEAQLDSLGFLPAASSPALDAGIAIDGLVTDFDGANRPYGLAYDVGAYELAPLAGPPRDLSVAASGGQATVSWTAVAGASRYEVRRRVRDSAVYVSTGTVRTVLGSLATVRYADPAPAAGTCYQVRAVNALGESAWSLPVCQNPPIRTVRRTP